METPQDGMGISRAALFISVASEESRHDKQIEHVTYTYSAYDNIRNILCFHVKLTACYGNNRHT